MTSTPSFASLKHRLLCMVYEAVLLFGVLFCATFLFKITTQQFSTDSLNKWLQIYLFIVLGGYFTYFWGRNGQTLAMQTWRIKVVSADHKKLTFKQACLRYCACWLWFLPSLTISYLAGLQHWTSIYLILAWMVIWAGASKFDKNGQFLHDKLAGTQLISLPKVDRVDDTD